MGHTKIMLLDLTDILHESGQVMTREFCLEPDEVEEVELAEKVCGELHIQNARQNLVITGQAHAVPRLPCARCLEKFEYPLELTFEAAAPVALFHIPGQPNIPDEDADEEDDLLDDEIQTLFVENSLDVSELVRQAILLQTPINPLCTENCAGLAQFADPGGNTDPRLEQLKNWPRRHENSS